MCISRAISNACSLTKRERPRFFKNSKIKAPLKLRCHPRAPASHSFSNGGPGVMRRQVSAALIAHARCEAECRRLRRQKTSVAQFETIKLIGKGAFGEVRLCRDLKSNDLVALKVME